MNTETKHRILLVDLNNFARYPTLSIGYLAAVLREASFQVSVFSPLMVGVHGTTREVNPNRFSLLGKKLNHLAATSKIPWIRSFRNRSSKRHLSEITKQHRFVIEEFKKQLLVAKPQVVVISTYLMYKDLCAEICALCRESGIRTLIGGPYFVQQEVISEWLKIQGMTALIAGEVELDLPLILLTLLERGDPSKHTGVIVLDEESKPKGQIARPLKNLDKVPFPDFSDFPWNAYPNRIIPVITGRGCNWGACSFCSDVTSSAGRTFRSRNPDNVLNEISNHYRQHGVSRFVFVDLKLNSNVVMWRSIIEGIQSVVPDAQWIGSIHVGMEADNGLSLDELRDAAKAGCVRLTTGLESGSQGVSDLMKKGTKLETISSFLQNASSAGISCRCTMIIGYPGETVDDIYASITFLKRHSREIERVSLNRLQIISGTPLQRLLKRTPLKFKGFSIEHVDSAMAQMEHRNDILNTKSHRKAVMRLLTEVHNINVRTISLRAREFEGVM